MALSMESRDQAAVSASRAQALLAMIAAAGHEVTQHELLEVAGIALEEITAASVALSGIDHIGTKKPGLRPAPVHITPCDQGVVCQLLTAAS